MKSALHATFNSQLRHYQLCHFLVRGIHLLSSQLPGEHTDHKAASRCSEPIWNVHYSSTHHHCWYLFYLLAKGWAVESTPARSSQEQVLNLGPHVGRSTALPNMENEIRLPNKEYNTRNIITFFYANVIMLLHMYVCRQTCLVYLVMLLYQHICICTIHLATIFVLSHLCHL